MPRERRFSPVRALGMNLVPATHLCPLFSRTEVGRNFLCVDHTVLADILGSSTNVCMETMNHELQALNSRGGISSGRNNKHCGLRSTHSSQQADELLRKRATPSVADSAYQSMTTNVVDSTLTLEQASTQAQPEAYEISGTDLFIYKIVPDKDARRHGCGVRHAIEGMIQEDVFAKDPSRPRDIALELRMVGKTIDVAKLYIIIFCAPDLKQPLDAILELPVVVELRRSSRENVPQLGIIVVPRSIRRASDDFTIDACGQKAFFARHSTYCGSPVILRTNLQQPSQTLARKATFGGVLKVTYGSGETGFHGMTAGHAVKDLFQECTATPPGMRTESSTKRDGFDPLEWIADDDVLGRVLLPPVFPGVAAGRSTLTHDWALFDVATPLPNMVTRMQYASPHDSEDLQDRPILIAEKPHFPDDISAAVQLLGATEGPRDGELSSLSARLWLSHNECFVDAYMLNLWHGDGKKLLATSSVDATLMAIYQYVKVIQEHGSSTPPPLISTATLSLQIHSEKPT